MRSFRTRYGPVLLVQSRCIVLHENKYCLDTGVPLEGKYNFHIYTFQRTYTIYKYIHWPVLCANLFRNIYLYTCLHFLYFVMVKQVVKIIRLGIHRPTHTASTQLLLATRRRTVYKINMFSYYGGSMASVAMYLSRSPWNNPAWAPQVLILLTCQELGYTVI